ncbi:MFS transporter [Streptomyces marincola]|uniref:MFS transporter n=1 Tax=Streptomyces marincola TaxID=2878388 RepID=UPI001CF168AC|nr:MFS transporter [Streptomyces marincola]UCM91567.1 MFS transporter [Streptomyces marincola]
MTPAAAGLRFYRDIFRIPGARPFVGATLVGRLPMSALSLSTVFLITHVTDGYAAAGAVAAGGALCYALVVPQIGYAVDRFGQSRVLRPVAAAFGVAGALFVLAARSGAPGWLLFAAGAAFGALMPPLSALVRARWSHMTAADTSGTLLRSSYSFESVADELIFVIGPLLVSTVVLVHPSAGVVTVTVCGVAGCLLLAAQRRTEPPVLPRAPGGGRAMSSAGLRLVCGVYVCTAAMFAGWELSTMAFVDTYGQPWMVGGVLATYAVGSAVGGLWYGARQWRSPLDRQFLLALGAVVVGVGPLFAMPGVAALWAFSLFSGVLVAPTVIAGYSLVRQGLPAAGLTEGMAWLSTAVGVGRALGVLTVGVVADAHGARWAYAVTLACGCAGLLVALAGARQLRALAAARFTDAA